MGKLTLTKGSLGRGLYKYGGTVSSVSTQQNCRWSYNIAMFYHHQDNYPIFISNDETFLDSLYDFSQVLSTRWLWNSLFECVCEDMLHLLCVIKDFIQFFQHNFLLFLLFFTRSWVFPLFLTFNHSFSVYLLLSFFILRLAYHIFWLCFLFDFLLIFL